MVSLPQQLVRPRFNLLHVSGFSSSTQIGPTIKEPVFLTRMKHSIFFVMNEWRINIEFSQGWLVFVFLSSDFCLIPALVARFCDCLFFVFCLGFQIIRFVIRTFMSIFFIEIPFVLFAGVMRCGAQGCVCCYQPSCVVSQLSWFWTPPSLPKPVLPSRKRGLPALNGLYFVSASLELHLTLSFLVELTR